MILMKFWIVLHKWILMNQYSFQVGRADSSNYSATIITELVFCEPYYAFEYSLLAGTLRQKSLFTGASESFIPI